MFEGLFFKPLNLAPSVATTEKGCFLASAVADIKGTLSKAVKSFREDCIHVGFLLKQLRENGYYRVASRYGSTYDFTYADAFLSEPFFKFCSDQFNLCKSTVYALIQVAERFGDSTGKILPRYVNFEYSQLVEMAPLTEDELIKVTSDMSVSKIRSLKKKKKDKNVIEEPKPETVEIVVENPYLFKNVKDARDSFKLGVKRFFEKGNYKIMVNGSFIGGQAFGAELFDYLLKRGVFDADKET